MSNMNYPDLAGKVAVVTGAGGGIGRAVVAALRKQGVTVVATDRDPAALGDVDADRRELDVTRPQALHALAQAVSAEHGALDIWVNNAGFMERMPALELDEAGWQRTLDINLKGTFFGAQAAAKQMIPQGGGAIINLSSYAGVKPRPNCADYASAKAGAQGFVRSIAKELGRYNVTSNAVSLSSLMPDMPAEKLAEVMQGDHAKAQMARYTIRRYGKSDDVAALVTFLCSDAAEWITGQTYPLNGGYAPSM